ncbi:MAG: glycosyl hydrolase, partial [Halanaerobiaceae bacterium]
GVFGLKFIEDELQEITKIKDKMDIDLDLKSDIKIYAFRVNNQEARNWFNGETYTDLLNKEAVQKFIDLTYEKYKEQYGDQFGEYMPGIFTDEPNYINEGPNTRPWTLNFDRYFQKLQGYNIIEKLPLLFYEIDGYQKIRYDFFYTITKKFIDSFSKPIYKFCQENNLKFTGHYLREDTLYKQTGVIGAAMPHYQYMQVPGIDHLGRNIDDPLTLKQCASVAHQFGRNRVLCENFGVSGHSMSFEDQKWIADFHFSLGITYTCQHLTLYSMVGDRKRDYPPTFSYHQPYWNDYKLMNDYFARAGWVCSQGDYICDTLVLHPIASVWSTYSRDYENNIYDQELEILQDNLLSSQIGFDYGDEMIMEDKASIIKKDGEPVLKIAEKGWYKIIIVPPSLTWAQNTFELIQEFVNEGGKVIFTGKTPELIEGKQAKQKWQKLFDLIGVYIVENEFSRITNLMESLLDGEIVIRDEKSNYIKDIYTHLRRKGNEYYVFVSNKNREQNYNLEIVFPFRGKVSRLNLKKGKIKEVKVEEINNKRVKIKTEIPPAGSRAYLIELDKNPVTKDNQLINSKSSCEIARIDMSEVWDYERLNKNSLTLDYCRYSINNNPWSQEIPVWKIRNKMWDKAGLGEYKGVQPWVIEKKGITVAEKMNLKMRFNFYSKTTDNQIGLVVENIENWNLRVNGVGLDSRTEKYQWDKQFGLLDISDRVQKGENTIELSCIYQYGVEIEKIYLVGDFAVKQTGYKNFTITKEPPVLRNGSWVYQGYPFYSGNMVYKGDLFLNKKENIKYKLRLNKPQGTLYKIKVNDHKKKNIYSQPWEVDITDDCVNGKNRFEIEVVSSLRNTFGPLHHRLNRQPWTGPGQFVDENNWVEAYQFEDYGLINGVSILMEKIN